MAPAAIKLLPPLLLLACVAVQPASGVRSCDPHERCVSLRQCPSLAGVLAKGANMTDSDKAALRAMQCGWLPDSHLPTVCCPVVPVDSCGPHWSNIIITGPLADLTEFPWMARLGYRDAEGGLQYRCAASLISDRYLLTAARCVAGREKPVSVRLGELITDMDPDCVEDYGDTLCVAPAVDVDVEDVTPHPEYEVDSGSNDIALVRLRHAANVSDSVAPVCLPFADPNDESSARRSERYLTVLGWGHISPDVNATTSTRLVKRDVREVEHALCVEKYGASGRRIDADRQLCCRSRYGNDACHGDPGGPLTSLGRWQQDVRATLRGVVSFGTPTCATDGAPAVFTRVAHYLPWILANMTLH